MVGVVGRLKNRDFLLESKMAELDQNENLTGSTRYCAKTLFYIENK